MALQATDSCQPTRSEEIERSQRSAALERRGIFRRHAGFKREKNWGFIAEGDALLVYYSLLPCTVVLQFDPAEEGGLAMRSRACHERQAASVVRATGPLRRARACALPAPRVRRTLLG